MTRFTKILLAGTALVGVSAPAAAQQLPQSQDSYFLAGEAQLARQLAAVPNTNRAKNIILFVGDGMSVPTITASRIYEGQSRGVDGESNDLTLDTLPYSALVKTYTHDSQVADSAPTATAMVAGVKTRNGVIGVDQTVPHSDCAAQQGHEVMSLFEMAEAAGRATGVVSTARLTHATPAATYAHTANRDWESDKELGDAKAAGCKDIADQLVNWTAGDGFEIALGGGRSYFLPASAADPEDEGKTGRRTDSRDLTQEWISKGNNNVFVWNADQLKAADPAAKVLGLFEGSHMEYEADREKDKGGEPSIADMTRVAIERLKQNENGFVLMVEGGRIDHAHHGGNAARALIDTVAFDQAIKTALELTDPSETLIVVTADHSHAFTIQGYPHRGNDILGLAEEVDGEPSLADDGKPYTTLAYANGPGAVFPAKPKEGGEAEAAGVRATLTEADVTSVDYLQQATIPMSSETHTGDDVAVLASGPYAHLFHGVIEQNLIYHVMAKAADLMQDTASLQAPAAKSSTAQ